ncbi:MAG: F0F1 ATP synthase subunit epsilon [Oscillospiraceae bacterium]|nr:F0F1 ATP synthase subunit epsilon [Oscillospiraceae bacterium]
MNTFKLKVVASNKVFFDDECVSLIVPVADDGLCGFLANHENTVAPIEFGEMTIKKPDDSKIEAFVGSGFLEFFDNVATLVCLSVELPEEIDKRRAEEAKERAEEELRQKQSVLEHLQSQANLARAMERIKVKNRHEI